MPPFDHLHPAIVHFPIACLTLAPLLVALAWAWPRQRRGILAAALLLLGAGLAGAVLALTSGAAAERFARATPELRAALISHEHHAQRATLAFAALTFGLLLYWLVPLLRKRDQPPTLDRILLLLWLVASVACVAMLLRAAQEGGAMVHSLGTHAQPSATM